MKWTSFMNGTFYDADVIDNPISIHARVWYSDCRQPLDDGWYYRFSNGKYYGPYKTPEEAMGACERKAILNLKRLLLEVGVVHDIEK